MRFFGILISIFLMLPAGANVFEHEKPLKEIVKELPELNSINCTFRQEKQISGMIIKSSGDFKFEKGRGVTFYTTYPIKSTTSYTSKEYSRINDVINAISSKSYSRLEKDFKFYFENGSSWKLGLLTKQSSRLFNYLKSIEIEGNKNITKIVILNADSTKTSIWFK